MYIKYLSAVCAFGALFGACDLVTPPPITDKICEDSNGTKRACTALELSLIEDWNWVVAKITSFDINKFDEKFLSVVQGDLKNPKVVLMGEAHNHIDGILENWGYLNYLAKNGKINVLEEGGDAAQEESNTSIKKIIRVLQIIVQKRLIDEGVVYHPSNWDKLTAERLRPAIDSFFRAQDHLKGAGFMNYLDNISFSNWDKRGEKSYKYMNMVRRNTSLINSITQKLQTEEQVPVVVLAGFSHLPLGDYYTAYKQIPQLGLKLPPDFPRFYPLAEAYRTRRAREGNEKYYEERVGATQVIYEGLSNLGVNTVQATPRSSIKNWEETQN